MVEGACLENRCAGDRTGGSNPSLTAVSLENQAVTKIVHKFVHKMRVCELFYSTIRYAPLRGGCGDRGDTECGFALPGPFRGPFSQEKPEVADTKWK